MNSNPSTIFDIRSYGAVPESLASPAINAAIQACTTSGGGTVFIPGGTWRCGTIVLASNVHLYLSAGAVIESSLDLGDFHVLPGMTHGKGLLAAFRCENITISGEGCIHGRGPDFMDWTKEHNSYERYCSTPSEGPVVPKDRVDRMVYFQECKNIRVRDVHLKEAAAWCLNLVGCEDIWLTNLFIYGHERIPNNDGIHLCYCRRATIHGCHIHSGDDAIALTSIKGGTNDNDALYWTQEELLTPPWCEDITISNCVMSTRGSGVRIGFMDDFVRRVRVHDCVLSSCHRGFLVSARNNGRVENVLVHDCYLKAVLFPGLWWGGGEPFQISAMGAGNGHIRDIAFRNIEADSEHGVVMWTDARFSVSGVQLENCRIRLMNTPYGDNLGGFFDLRPRSTERDIPSGYFRHNIPGIYAHRIGNISIQKCHVEFPNNPAAYFSSGIHAASCAETTLKDNVCPSQLEDYQVDY